MRVNLKPLPAFFVGICTGVCLTVMAIVLMVIVLYVAVIQPTSERESLRKYLGESPMPSTSEVAPKEASVEEIVEAMGQAYLEREGNVGLAIGIIYEGKREVFTFGYESKEADAQPVDGRTLFEIGSISKPFTGLLLAEAVRRGEIKLDEPLAKALPDDVRLPLVDDQPITFQHLATHTSGLPRLPPTMIVWRALAYQFFLANPYFGLDEAQQDRALNMIADYGAKRKSEYLYSNFAFTLLGRALASRAGLPYRELFAQRLAEPLGLKQTGAGYPTPEQGSMAIGYDGGVEASSWVDGPIRGAGGIVSSAEEMLTILEAHLHPEASPLGESITLALTPHSKLGDAGAKMGLGWMIALKKGGFWHSGGTGGFRSYTSFQPASEVAVVVLANSTDGAVSELGLKIIRMLHRKVMQARAKA